MSSQQSGGSDLVAPMSSFTEHFEFQSRESALYTLWEKSGAFSFSHGPISGAKPFVICMPPPNANGELHLGHSYGYSVMDTMGRYFRGQGRRVLLLPGKDHAGIQTQVVFENKLRASGQDPARMDRSALYDSCYAFCLDRSGYMRTQEKALGLSADWERELFTLDPRLSKTVHETFEKLWKDGLVYKGKRIVNWSVLSGTAISDVEVERKEVESQLTYIRYPFVSSVAEPARKQAVLDGVVTERGSDGYWYTFHAAAAPRSDAGNVATLAGDAPQELICVEAFEVTAGAVLKKVAEQVNVPEDGDKILKALQALIENGGGSVGKFVRNFTLGSGLVTATTRPETMLGDTALAVHPKDPRYKHLVGSQVEVPLIKRKVPIIADERVEISFGTGVIKVTPAHDFLDFDIGTTHGLEVVQVVGPDGRMTSEAGTFVGLSAKECRNKVLQELESQGRVELVEKITHKVPVAERSKDVIEPLISEQWFIAVDAEGKSLKAKALALLDSGKIDIHPPHFKKEFEHWLKSLRDWNISRQLWWGHRLPVWYRAGSSGKDEVYVGASAPTGDGWKQDTDTFDTWFSSGQWAYTTLGAVAGLDLATGKSPENVFPSQCMVMGRDILFFWACRMLLLTAYRMNDVPWKTIYFTGLIRDEHGQKMSKSKGNGIEPGVMSAKYGSDALRLALLFGTTPGNDVNMGEGKISGYSKFINKLWNAGKLLEMRVLGGINEAIPAPKSVQSETARWIVDEVNQLRRRVRYLMDSYQIGQALTELYSFTWDTFCDWYLEIVKILSKDERPGAKRELAWASQYSFGCLLEMLHPFIPYVTEELYQRLPGLGVGKVLGASMWREEFEVAASAMMKQVVEVVKALRSGKVALGGLGSGISVALAMDAMSAEATQLVQELGRVKIVPAGEIPADRAVKQAFALGVLTFDHPDRKGFSSKLKKEADSLKESIQRLEARLNSDFAKRAKPEVVQAEREKLLTSQKTLEHLSAELKILGEG